MIVFARADGTIIDVLPSPVYQGSNLSGSIYFVAPLSPSNAVTVAFKLPNGIYTKSYSMTGVSELEGVTDKLGKAYSVWEWQDTNAEVTQYAGVCIAQISVYLPNGQLLTTSATSFDVHAGTLPPQPELPSQDVYEYILRYLGRLDGRTVNVPNLVASIQPASGNSFTYTDNKGIVSAPIVLGEIDYDPTYIGAASVLKLPVEAWQPVYDNDGQTVTGYTATITAAQHGQMQDGATAIDLWVSFDATNNDVLSGVYQSYTVSESGDITLNVTTPIAMTVRVWNGKGLTDETARADITTLQKQVDELEQSGVDLTAREDIVAETKRAEAAEKALTNSITAETERAQETERTINTAVEANTTDIQDLQAELEHIEASRVTSVNGQTGDAIVKTYDLEIKTQEEFEAFYATLDSGTCTAKSVLLFGDNGPFTRSDGKGLKLPQTLCQLDGINNATIEVSNFAYDETTNKAAVWYDELPTDGNHSISNLTVKCEGRDVANAAYNAYGFCNCTNLTNCASTAIAHGYKQTLPAVRSYGYAYYQCAYLANCSGSGVGGPLGGGETFYQCDYVSSCLNTFTGMIAQAAWNTEAKTANVSIARINTTSVIFVMPVDESAAEWARCNIKAVSQNTNLVSFECTVLPTNSLSFSVIILNT